MNDIFDRTSNETLATADGGRVWTRPCVQRMSAGSAEEGASTVTDFIDAES